MLLAAASGWYPEAAVPRTLGDREAGVEGLGVRQDSELVGHCRSADSRQRAPSDLAVGRS